MNSKSKNSKNSKNSDNNQFELVEKTVSIRRTAKVVKGGRIFSFSVTAVVGDGKSRVGMGIGKAREVPIAIQKAVETAKKSMVTIPLINATLQHQLIGSHGATKVVMLPASDGTGVIAGGAMRAVLECLGVHNVLAKRYGSSNPLNIARATIKALMAMHDPVSVAMRRGLTADEVRSYIKDE
ncbi:MAG TPA: 30S ribosomal protein S5 [Gammaproteobacteria bacterium]|nr:30S ribosomal protein S5 [Gammaproteobacteria bacterium]